MSDELALDEARSPALPLPVMAQGNLDTCDHPCNHEGNMCQTSRACFGTSPVNIDQQSEKGHSQTRWTVCSKSMCNYRDICLKWGLGGL